MSEQRFWFLYAEGGGAPTHRHDTEESAIAEAERLTRQLRRKVYVLEAKAVVELREVEWTMLGDDAAVVGHNAGDRGVCENAWYDNTTADALCKECGHSADSACHNNLPW